MSAYERSGVSRGADPASNGTHHSVGISKRPEQIHPKAPLLGLSALTRKGVDMDRSLVARVVEDYKEANRRAGGTA